MTGGGESFRRFFEKSDRLAQRVIQGPSVAQHRTNKSDIRKRCELAPATHFTLHQRYNRAHGQQDYCTHPAGNRTTARN